MHLNCNTKQTDYFLIRRVNNRAKLREEFSPKVRISKKNNLVGLGANLGILFSDSETVIA
jgi:hypothetical protein